MKKILQVVAVLALLAPAAAWTQQKSIIQLTSVAEVEVTVANEKGEKAVKRVAVDKTAKGPGDVVIFTTHYTNTGKQPATGVVITNPVDEHMVYVDGSAEGNNTRIEFSADGGKTYHGPGKTVVKNAQGLTRPARAEDFTHIRWTPVKPLAAGATGSVSFKARIK